MLGGPDLTRPGVRAVPSLTYLERQPDFSIGPEKEDDDNINLAQQAEAGKTAARVEKTATGTAQSANIVPQGGLFWDGRADTLQNQAEGPLLDPREMDGGSVAIIAEKLRHAPYAKKFLSLFGERVLKDTNLLFAEATFAVDF
jgi:cytochrome c peroxidase